MRSNRCTATLTIAQVRLKAFMMILNLGEFGWAIILDGFWIRPSRCTADLNFNE